MNNEGMANLICELRKSKKMTQRQLAEKLNITDKAVSKWERGLGYPDISVLSSLADALGITVNELLNGKINDTPPIETNEIVETTLKYANKVTVNKKQSIKFIWKIVFTIVCLLGISICMICDMATSGDFTWSLYPITSITFAWLIIIPLFQFKKNEIFMALISLSIFIMPFIIILNKIIGGTRLMLPIGIRVSLIGIIYMWCIYFLSSIKKIVKWSRMSICILLAIPVNLLVNYTISKFTSEPLSNINNALSCVILCIASIVVFSIGKIRKTNKLESFSNEQV